MGSTTIDKAVCYPGSYVNGTTSRCRKAPWRDRLLSVILSACIEFLWASRVQGVTKTYNTEKEETYEQVP